MKLGFTIAILFFLNTAFAQTSKQLSILYTAQTRGQIIKINISNKQFLYSYNGTKKSIDTDTAFWTELNQQINNTKLNKLKKHKAPSKKSYSDAALQAHLQIKTNNKTYTSQPFDHGNPPIKIKALIDLLLSKVP